MRRIFTADIYGATPEIVQSTPCTYEFIRKQPKFMEDGGDTIEVNLCQLTIPLMIKPSDLLQDLETGIREDLGLDDLDIVKFECDIVQPSLIIEQPAYDTTKLFV
jgi:hypothetical protein